MDCPRCGNGIPLIANECVYCSLPIVRETRPEPSRLEIAAMMMQGLVTAHHSVDMPENTQPAEPEDIAFVALEYADALIAASRGGK